MVVPAHLGRNAFGIVRIEQRIEPGQAGCTEADPGRVEGR
jgi:hypothetical protein